MRYLIIFIFINLFAHPLNLTKMELNTTNHQLFMRFAIFNVYKVFKEEFNKTKVNNYILQHIKIDNCKIIPNKTIIKNEVVVDNYFKVKCNGLYNISFDMFFEFDKTQRGVLNIDDKKVLSFSPSKSFYKLKEKQNQFLMFLKEGIVHILEGIDHIFFISMLIVSVLLRHYTLKTSLIEIIKVATAFTFSHSVTLILSMLGILNPPEQIIEVLIAVTILFVSLNNFYRWANKEWLMAFLFGFIHGFGFANALKEMNIENNFIQIVLGFNFGVEIGQIFIILTIVPLLFILKSDKILKILSIISTIISILWIIERM
jgi:hypothetical protein